MSVAAFPIDFSLYDEHAHYVLYITDDPTEEHRLTVELENTSSQEISFEPLGDENDYHFELRFRNGTLSEKTLAILQNGAQKLLSSDDVDKWKIRLNQNNTSNPPHVSMCFRNQQPVTFPVKVILQHISADAGSGARGTRAEFIPHKMTLGGNTPLTGSREQHLFIANHSGQKHIPLHVGFVGSNRILNDGTAHPGNKLTLQIQNVAKPSQEHLETPKIKLRANGTDNKGSRFVVSFDIQLDGEEKPWAVCKERELKLVGQTYKAGWGVRIKAFKGQILAKDGWIRSSDPSFQKMYPDLNQLFDFSDWSKNEAQSQQLVFTSNKDMQLNQGDYFEIELAGFQSTLPSGSANMYLNYHNIPGYWDGHFVLTVEKTQLLFMDVKDALGNSVNSYVGIGTASPNAKLEVTLKSEDTVTKPLIVGKGTTNYLTILNNGNLGIGTTPTAKLDVGGTGDADGQISLQLRAGNSSQSFKSSQITMGWAGSAQYRHAIKTRHHGGQKATNAIDFYVWNHGTDGPDDIGTLPTLTLDSGSVGIGTTNPSAKLHIVNTNQDANGNTLILGPSTDQGATLRLGYAADYSWIQSHSAKPLAINPIGNNVGIGTTNPGAKLEVNGEIKATFFRAGQGSARTVSAPAWYRIAEHPGHWANAEFTLRDVSANRGRSSLTFRIGSNINLPEGISFTLLSHSRYNPPTFTKIRILIASVNSPHYVEVFADPGGISARLEYSIYDNLHTNPPHSNGWQPVNWTEISAVPAGYVVSEFDVDRLFVVGDTTSRFSITRGGHIGIGISTPQVPLHIKGGADTSFPTTSRQKFGLYVEEHAAAKQWHTTSDARVKSEFALVDPMRSLRTIMDLSLHEYQYIPEFEAPDRSKKYHGFLAQEVEKVMPSAVSMIGDQTLINGAILNDFRVLASDQIFNEAVGALQALYKIIQKQEVRIAALENLVESTAPDRRAGGENYDTRKGIA